MRNRCDRTSDLDTGIMRIFAAFFVVLIHASGTGSGAALFYNAAARFSVPLFVMISGRYLLRSGRSLPELLKKCARIFCLMLAWSAAYYLFDLLTGVPAQASLPRYLLTEPVHLWYLWACMALYLMVPVLRVFCENADRTEYRYALAGTFLLGSVLLILLRAELSSALAVIVDKAKLPYQLGFVCCFLFGDYCRRFPGNGRRALGWGLFAAGALGNAAAALLLAGGSAAGLTLSFFAPTNILAAAGLYTALLALPLRPDFAEGRAAALLGELSSCTLGIYLLHPMLLRLLLPVLDRLPAAPDAVAVPAAALAVFLLSTAIVFVLRKIPMVQKLVGE